MNCVEKSDYQAIEKKIKIEFGGIERKVASWKDVAVILFKEAEMKAQKEIEIKQMERKINELRSKVEALEKENLKHKSKLEESYETEFLCPYCLSPIMQASNGSEYYCSQEKNENCKFNPIVSLDNYLNAANLPIYIKGRDENKGGMD